MTRQRRSISGDIPVIVPEGKSGRRQPPPGKRRWVVVGAILAVIVLGVLLRQFVMQRP